MQRENDKTERMLDSAQDGWETEQFADVAKSQLHDLLDLRHSLVVADGIVTDELRPRALEVAFDDGEVVVRRIGESSDQAYQLSGADGARLAVQALIGLFEKDTDIDMHVKIVGVDLGSAQPETTVLIDGSGLCADGRAQFKAQWRCVWESTGDHARLVRIEVIDYEEVVVRSTSPWFVESTESILSHNESWNEQLAYGLNDWLSVVERTHIMHIAARYGLSVGDVNGDGLDDLYVCSPAGLPNRLFVQNPDGTATDVSHEAGVDWLDHTSAALLIDLDNDGDQDLVIATMAGVIVMSNDGNAHFTIEEEIRFSHVDIQSLAASDYDLDGDLDLYVCFDRAVRDGIETGRQFVYYDANDGAPNVLLRNDGNWTFTDSTIETGLDIDNRRHTIAAAWEDYDNDGDPDLYVANDYGQNCLYENRDGHFVNVANEAGVVDYGSGMSADWGDFDRDGLMDLYVGNMFSSAGSRITSQAQFQQGIDEPLRALYKRFAKGNTLFRNNGDGTFSDVGQDAHVEMGRWAWGSVFVDLNNDGWEDILVTNGYITNRDTGDL